MNTSDNQGASQSEESSEVRQPTELEVLKSRARLLNITFSNNISVETLRQKINDKLEDKPLTEGEDAAGTNDTTESQTAEQAAAILAAPNPLIGETVAKPARKLTLRQLMVNTQLKLVRLRITCLDPKKKDLHGEIFTIANEYLGTVRKFIPFGEVTDDGWHVPYCLYRMMDERKFLNITTKRDRVSKQIQVQSNWAKEFALEVLPPLSAEELKKLAITQAASMGG